MAKTTYRPDIDGLRALAVLAVVAFHVSHRVLPGGFVGVDVFFVISGFLISSHIFADLHKQKFSIIEFYRRRIRRIFPALIAVLSVTFILGWLFFLPDEFHLLGKHIVGASTFVSNFLAGHEYGYFDKCSDLNPLLHLWSLGVEEQYYIFWPLFLILLWKFKRNAITWTLWLVAISFSLEIFYLHFNPSHAFYFPQGRMWELLLGSLGATTFFDKILTKTIRNVFSIFGCILLIAAFFVVSQQRVFPGFWALMPTFATLFIILGQNASYINRKILSHPMLISLGVISYPLYLWHWPLLTFSRVLELPTYVPIILSFVLAFLTYYFIEKPIRFERKIPTSQLCRALFIIFVLGWITARSGIRCRLTSLYLQSISDASGDWAYPPIGFDGKNIKTNILPGKTDDTILFLGDSHMEQYWPRFEYLSKAHELNQTLVFASYDSCVPLPKMEIKIEGFFCQDVYEMGLKLAFQKNVKTVVFGGYWEQNQEAFNSKTKLEEFENDLRRLKASGKEIVIVLSNPTGPEFDPKLMVGNRLHMPTAEFQKPLSRRNFEDRYKPIEKILRAMAFRVGAKVIEPVISMCDDDRCATTYDGKPIYKDADHIRPFYARERATFIDTILGK